MTVAVYSREVDIQQEGDIDLMIEHSDTSAPDYTTLISSSRGVYSSVYLYIHIYKKLPFLADFIKTGSIL